MILRETKVFLEFPFLYLDIFYVLLTADKKRTVSSSSHSLLTSFTSLSLSLVIKVYSQDAEAC